MSRALGRYELLRPLARGGMGEVYLARRRAAGVEKWLVVKRMRAERSGDTRFLDLFMREAKLSMSLAHQNIVPVFDFGRIDDQVFLAMERVEGKDLGSSLQKSGKGIAPVLAAFVAAECLQALDYAHRRKGPDGALLGIVHRDVTPRNVLLSWSGEVKLTDFGIAALAGDTPSRAAGTPAYMAPEQARGETLDVRADIYAVGLVLYEALTGERARKGNDRETVLDIAKRGVLDPLPEGVHPTLRAIVERATSSDREARYPDARSMLEELDAFIVGERAAKKGDAPSRQLGAWLTDVWKDARDDEGALDAQIEAGVLVSFLDDGPLDVVGTGTQRSALATAADEPVPSGPSDKVEVSPLLTEAPAPPAPASPDRAPTEHVRAAEPPSSRRLFVPLAIAVVAVAGLLAWKLSDRGDDKLAAESPPPVQADAMTVAEATHDAPLVALAAPDAAVAQATPDAGVAEHPHPRPNPREGSAKTGSATNGSADRGSAAGSGSAAVVAPPTVTKRKVRINSKPWSNFTVDDGTAQYTTAANLELTPGPHTIHFTGSPYIKTDKTVTITVPDTDGFTVFETLEPAPAP